MINLSKFQNFNIKLWHTYTLQAIGVGLQIVNIVSPIVPEKHKVTVAAILGALQWLQANLAHLHNVDGTPQSEAGPAVPQATAPPKAGD